ncbi:unnamed protein product [Victoria cruziana]
MADDADMVSLVYELQELLGRSAPESSPPPVGSSMAKPQDPYLLPSSLGSFWPSNQSDATGVWTPLQPHDEKHLVRDSFNEAYLCFPGSSPPPARFFSGEFLPTRPPSGDRLFPQRFCRNFCPNDYAAADGHFIPFLPHSAESIWRFGTPERSVHDYGVYWSGSAMHADCLTQTFPAPSTQEQTKAESLREGCLFPLMGQSVRGNPCLSQSPIGAVPRCSNCGKAFHRTGLSSTSPGTISHVGRGQVANRKDNALPKRTQRQSALRQQDESVTGDFAVEMAMDESKEIWRKEEDSSMENQQPPMYTSLEEVKGRIVAVAKEKHGRQFLESKCKEGSPEELETIVSEIKDHLYELVFDAFGNYLVDSILDACNARQRKEILYIVTRRRGLLIHMSTNHYAAKIVRKLIATVKTADEICLVRLALKPGVLTLIKDSNGHHIVQDYLKNFSSKDCEFLVDEAIAYCVEIATHNLGCSLLQNLLEDTEGQKKHRLINEICENTLYLAQHRFGNYVVQSVLDLKQNASWAKVKVLSMLRGRFVALTMDKFSSNVVEKCLCVSVEKEYALIVRELLEFPDFLKLVKDSFGNYVIQSALRVWKGSAVHNDLVGRIRANASALRCPIGRRVLQCLNSELSLSL